jgi:hypothetical protein
MGQRNARTQFAPRFGFNAWRYSREHVHAALSNFGHCKVTECTTAASQSTLIERTVE